MATYPNTGSILDSSTRTALSTMIVLMVNNEPVGAIQSLNESQGRSNKRVTELGSDLTLEVVPNETTTITLTADRIVYDGLSITESFSRGFRNLQSQRIPFDIVMIDTYTGSGNNAVITTYAGCFFSSIGRAYSSDNYVITESVGIDVATVSSTRSGGSVAESQGVGGSRQMNPQIDVVELQADSGVRRGTLDFGGLIEATF